MQIETISALASIALAVALLALLLALVSLRVARAARQQLSALTHEGERSGTGQWVKALAAVVDHGRRLSKAEDQLETLESAAARAVSRIGHVQFQAYDDAGVGQSSSLALLDDAGSGVVITTLHARVGTRIYVKRLIRGESETLLGEEERAAIDAALATPGGPRRNG